MADQLFTNTINHLQEELRAIRTGRANPAFVEDIKVEAYEATVPIKEIASISVPEPQSLAIQPWDTGVLKAIEKAIQESNLGLQPINDGQLIRLVFPPLTEERRKEFIKVIRDKAEETRVSIRSTREKEMKKLKQQESDGSLSEDDSQKKQKELQTKVDAAIEEIKSLSESKEKDIATL